MRFSKGCIAGLLFWLPTFPTLYAKDLGAIGPVYAIAEPDALTFLLNKIKKKVQSGEFARLQREAAQRILEGMKHLPPVEGIEVARQPKRRLIDPSVVYEQALFDEEGRVVVPAGTRINPLEIVSFSSVLVFFDGRDPGQNEAVRKLMSRSKRRIKPVLVAGSWFELSQSWQTQVYYDQYGMLSRRFGIRAVPTMIRQHGNRFLVEEIPAKLLK